MGIAGGCTAAISPLSPTGFPRLPSYASTHPPAGISVDLTTHIHHTLPRLADEWLTASLEIENSAGGLATEHGWIATTGGTPVAESLDTLDRP